MSATTADKSAKKPDTSQAKPPGKGGKRKLLLILLPLLLLGGGGAAAFFFVPTVRDVVRKIMPGGGGEEHAEAEPGAAPAARGAFVEFPEMTITLPNGGRPRQLRLKLAAEINGDAALLQPELLGPRVYDSLVLYLRSLRDGELEGALAMDRLRGDLHRRLELLLGPGKLRDVLITSFVVA